MKLQNLVIIFIIIALPVILILSAFVSYQVDTARLKAEYTNILLNATHDSVTTFQLNSTNNKYSTISDSLIRDIEGAINTFETSLATNLRYPGGNSSAMSYVPALVFTLYDGYYIYTPTLSENGNFEHTLKPYVYYTKEYTDGNITIVINYTLDNYVSVYYFNKSENVYESRAGYLEVLARNQNSNGLYKNTSTGEIKYNKIVIPRDEELYENTYSYDIERVGQNDYVKNWTIQDENSVSQSAYNYYSEAYDFTVWYNNIIDKLSGSTEINIKNKENLKITENNVPYAKKTSKFNDEKYDVIETSLVNNLVQAMHAFNTYIDSDFQMPELSGQDWEKILNNVCVISFMQGIPCGTTVHNDYVIVPSSENEQFVNENSIYYIAFDDTIGGYEGGKNYMYHRIGCPELKGEHIIGYHKLDFLRQVAINQSTGDRLKERDEDTGAEYDVYYYRHFIENACYYCIVNAKDASIDSLEDDGTDLYKTKLLAYYRAMARTKYELSKVSSYINNSAEQRFNSAMNSVSFQNRN